MTFYYFDLREGDEIVPDEEGMELSDLLDVQVRDNLGPVMQVRFTFEITRKP